VERIAAAGITRVIASTQDPNPLVAGRGFQFLRDRGIEVVVGPGRDRALRLNRAYFTFITERRPFVIAKAATSIDNCVSPHVGARGQNQLARISAARARHPRRSGCHWGGF
jgi:diaminohydroxyphosphoribosylaminopyrimidine deaminase/5-amino-6-(5-phosphoribosylamino)uracil reductase